LGFGYNGNRYNIDAFEEPNVQVIVMSERVVNDDNVRKGFLQNFRADLESKEPQRALIKYYRMNMSKNFLGVLLAAALLFLPSCGNDWPTKEQVKDLHGEWKLVSIKATDKVTFQDTTWAVSSGFIDFSYTGREGATPFTYSLTSDQLIDGYYSIPEENMLLVMIKDPVSQYENSTVGLVTGKQSSFELSNNQLIIKGECLIRNGVDRLTSGKKMNLIAVFKR